MFVHLASGFTDKLFFKERCCKFSKVFTCVRYAVEVSTPYSSVGLPSLNPSLI